MAEDNKEPTANESLKSALGHAKCVLFDMDGVLIDSMPNHAIAWVQSMTSFGITMTANDVYLTEGARGVDTIRKMVKEHKDATLTRQKHRRCTMIKHTDSDCFPNQGLCHTP